MVDSPLLVKGLSQSVYGIKCVRNKYASLVGLEDLLAEWAAALLAPHRDSRRMVSGGTLLTDGFVVDFDYKTIRGSSTTACCGVHSHS